MISIPHSETLRLSAIEYLRQINQIETGDLLSQCDLEIGTTQSYIGSTITGLNITIRCSASHLTHFYKKNSTRKEPTIEISEIKNAIDNVLPTELCVHKISAKACLIDKDKYEKSELEQLIEKQKDLMISVATGGPRIQDKNKEYQDNRKIIKEKLLEKGIEDINPFDDLWAWYGRWSRGDLPRYQSRREYISNLYQPLLEQLVRGISNSPMIPTTEPTGWDKVDRIISSIITSLEKANVEEDYQTIGILCRECLISLAKAVYKPDIHKTSDGIIPSDTDAYRMLEAYFSAEFRGKAQEALRRHAKASLSLANELQHKQTANQKLAALCAEATRTVVNIVAITSGKH